MEDMASTVRKSAFQLLCDLIRNNPFGIKIIELEKESIQRECEKEEEALQKLVDENDKLVEELDELVVNAGTQANGKKSASKVRRGRRRGGRDSLSTTSEESEDQEEMETDEVEEEEEEEMNRTVVAAQKGGDLEIEAKKQKNQERILVQRSKVNYLKDTLAFISEIDAAIPKLCKMLFSKTQTDVLEVCKTFIQSS